MAKMDYSKECLYDVEWQVLRVSLLGISGTDAWEKALEKYMYEGVYDIAERAWRVVNLCNATLLAYGNRQDVTTQREVVKQMREDAQVKGALHRMGSTWNWHKVCRDVWALYDNDRTAFDAVRDNLKKRVKTSQYKARKRGEADNESGFKHRSELQEFLLIMDETMS